MKMANEEIAPWERITATGSLEVEVEDESNVDPLEEQALEKGWVPKDQWRGNPDEWRPAKEFIDRSSFFEKINNQKKEIERYRQDLEAVKSHMQKLREAQQKDASARLEHEKLIALEEQDYNRVVEVDRRIREIEAEVETSAAPRSDPNLDAIFDEWKSENRWYETDPELQALADGFGIAYRQRNPSASVEDLYKYVTDSVKRTNPQKFKPATGEAQSQSPNNSSVPQRTNQGPKYTYRDLSEDELRVARRFVKLGLYKDVQEYINELADIG